MTPVRRRTVLKLLGVNLGAVAIRGPLMLSPAAAACQPVPSAAPTGAASQTGATTSKKTVSDQIAGFIVGARFKDLPAAVIRKAKQQIVYHFGLAFSGWATAEAGKMREVLRQIGPPKGGATVIAERIRLSASDAAFANCTLMRANWRDDVVWPAGIHAGLMTLPTALALGEVKHASGQEMLLALVLGYEILGKLGTPVDSWAAPLPRRPTMIFGGYGPITVGGRLLKLDRQRMANALGYAANLGMGVPEGGQTDHFYGLISRNATFAAQLAEVGGAPYSKTTIEGATGLYRSYFGAVPVELQKLIGSLGSDWEILRAAQKRYPGTSQNTVASELFLDLVKEQKLTPEQILKLDAFVSYAEDSVERKNELTFRGPFRNWMDAYSSLPYVFAIVLIDGKADPARFRDDGNLNDKTIAGVMQKINITFEAGHGAVRYCRLEAYTADGRKLVRDSGHSRISDNFTFPFPPSEWADWLQKDGRQLLPLEQLRRLEHLISDLENLDDVSKLMASVRSGP